MKTSASKRRAYRGGPDNGKPNTYGPRKPARSGGKGRHSGPYVPPPGTTYEGNGRFSLPTGGRPEFGGPKNGRPIVKGDGKHKPPVHPPPGGFPPRRPPWDARPPGGWGFEHNPGLLPPGKGPGPGRPALPPHRPPVHPPPRIPPAFGNTRPPKTPLAPGAVVRQHSISDGPNGSKETDRTLYNVPGIGLLTKGEVINRYGRYNPHAFQSFLARMKRLRAGRPLGQRQGTGQGQGRGQATGGGF